MQLRRDSSGFGIGVDVVAVERVSRLAAANATMLDAVFTRRELTYCESKRRPHEHLAARFAGKEAVLKAFATGLSRRMRWTEVEIVNDARGRPEVHLHGEVAAVARRRDLTAVEISLSHAAGVAVAQALAVWGSPRVQACASI